MHEYDSAEELDERLDVVERSRKAAQGFLHKALAAHRAKEGGEEAGAPRGVQRMATD